jgi:hypothetical protein
MKYIPFLRYRHLGLPAENSRNPVEKGNSDS